MTGSGRGTGTFDDDLTIGREPARKLASGLHVVATPIGNLGDVSARARETLAAADRVVCEDSRVTGKLLALLGLQARLVVYNDHNAPAVRPGLLALLAEGAALALVSDAGTPCINDPGYRLVRECLEAGFPVRAVPGPSAPIAALSIAGLPTDRFLYAGFMPPKTHGRRKLLSELAPLAATLVFLETGPRLAASLADALAELGDREAAIAREITKLHEQVDRAPLSVLAARYAALPPPPGEIVLLIEGARREPEPPTLEAIGPRLLEAAATMRPRDAAKALAAETGIPARELYEELLRLRGAR